MIFPPFRIRWRPWLRTQDLNYSATIFFCSRLRNYINYDNDQDFTSVFSRIHKNDLQHVENTHYIPHTAPFSIIEVNGVGLDHTGLYRTRIWGFIISLYSPLHDLLLHPFHLRKNEKKSFRNGQTQTSFHNIHSL